MEGSINERIIQLKNHLKLTDIEFCNKCGISTGTLQRIKTGNEVSSKTIDSITKLGASREWLINNKGEMLLPGQVQVTESRENVWRDALVSELKDEINFLRNALKLALGSKEANFPNDIIGAGLFQMEKFGNIVRA